MASKQFNIAKGRFIELHNRVANNDPANAALVVVLLKVAESDALLEDRDTLAAILAAGNTEADFTNYARKVLTDSVVSPSTVNDTDNHQWVTIPDQTWVSAGGAVNNTTAKLLICYDPDSTGGTDSNIVPLVFIDYIRITNGSDLDAEFSENGYGRAQSAS